MPARDLTGAIRYYDSGNLPLPREVLEYHREKLEERAKKENRPVAIEMAIDDVYEISRTIAKGC
jgi:methylaspartate mutase epsilon subunit